MKRQLIRAGFPMLLLGALSACEEDSIEPDISATFQTSLSGSAEVPPVTSTGVGSAVFTLNEAENAIDYTLNVGSLASATVAHIHFGSATVAGPVIVFLWGPVNAPGVSLAATTQIKTGRITAVDVNATNATATVPAFDGTFARLVQEMKAGNTYVNVHTVARPGGEIRGQIVLQ